MNYKNSLLWVTPCGLVHLSEAYIQVYSLFTDVFSDESWLGTCSFPFWSSLPRLSPSELRLHCDSALRLRKVSVQMQTQECLVLWKLSDLKRELPGITAMGAPGVGVWKRRSSDIVWFLILTLVIGILSECLPAYGFCLWEIIVTLFIGTHGELFWMGEAL